MYVYHKLNLILSYNSYMGGMEITFIKLQTTIDPK